MSKGQWPHKKAANESFEALCEGLSPEALLHAVMVGKSKVEIGGKATVITAEMVSAAEKLIRYRLPTLNSIDARVGHVTMTHEQWIDQLDEEADDGG